MTLPNLHPIPLVSDTNVRFTPRTPPNSPPKTRIKRNKV